MNPYEWFDGYCMEQPDATKDYKEKWSWDRYFVGADPKKSRRGSLAPRRNRR